MEIQPRPERVETLIIGGGQAGLSMGYHLSLRNRPFLIVDASERIGDAWRHRWDSLRLFTPARFSGLDGMPFPGDPQAFPTKDAMAAYLEDYAEAFDLPVRSGTRVLRLERSVREAGGGTGFRVRTDHGPIEADNVVVAMSSYQRPKIPDFAHGLRPTINQLHSADYRNLDQMRPGPVLVVGAANSGAEIAMELSTRHRVWLSGRKVAQVPFRPRGLLGRLFLVRLVLRGVYHRLLSVDNPLGRKARPKFLHGPVPLVRVKNRDLARAGVERLPRTRGVQAGLPVLADGRALEPANVIWCTGFDSSFDWIGLPSQEDGPVHESGIVRQEPGLYFVGLNFLHAVSSGLVHGVGRDAARVAAHLDRRMAARKPKRPTSGADEAVHPAAKAPSHPPSGEDALRWPAAGPPTAASAAARERSG